MIEATTEVTASQIHDLEKLLAHSLAASEIMVSSAPAVALVRRVSSEDHLGKAGIAVDVDLGHVVVCLFAPDWLTNKIGGPRLSDLAELFAQRVREVHRGRQRHTDRFARARRMTDAVIERSAVGMTLVSLKTTPQRVDANLTGCYLEFEATVSMLNDALQPYMQRIVAWTPRELASGIKCYASEQRARLRALERMRASGAVFQIDVLAERVIALAGVKLAECVTTLLTGCDTHEGRAPALILNENAEYRTAIHLRSGRVMASIWISNVGVVAGRTFIVNHYFPESVTDALAGYPATAIVDRPLLRGIKIRSARRHYDTQTDVQLRMPTRLISAAELDEPVPLAA